METEWLKPCRYQSFGCHSLIPAEATILLLKFKKRKATMMMMGRGDNDEDDYDDEDEIDSFCHQSCSGSSADDSFLDTVHSGEVCPSRRLSWSHDHNNTDTDNIIIHNHEKTGCEFQPLQCPFMLCSKKLPKASLIKHLYSEHHLCPLTGKKSCSLPILNLCRILNPLNIDRE